jgi:hypothetical protein
MKDKNRIDENRLEKTDTNISVEVLRDIKQEYIKQTDFDVFWNYYPKKVGKEAARKSWDKMKPMLNDVLGALHWQVESDQWSKSNGQFIPNPATYLNQGRWQDEKPLEVIF